MNLINLICWFPEEKQHRVLLQFLADKKNQREAKYEQIQICQDREGNAMIWGMCLCPGGFRKHSFYQVQPTEARFPYQLWIQRFLFSFCLPKNSKGPWDAVCIANGTHSEARRKPRRYSFETIGIGIFFLIQNAQHLTYISKCRTKQKHVNQLLSQDTCRSLKGVNNSHTIINVLTFTSLSSRAISRRWISTKMSVPAGKSMTIFRETCCPLAEWGGIKTQAWLSYTLTLG